MHGKKPKRRFASSFEFAPGRTPARFHHGWIRAEIQAMISDSAIEIGIESLVATRFDRSKREFLSAAGPDGYSWQQEMRHASVMGVINGAGEGKFASTHGSAESIISSLNPIQ